MAYVTKETITVSLSTLGAGSAFSSGVFTGFVQSVYVKGSSAMGAAATAQVVSDTTTLTILSIKDPSTNGAYYYPRGAVHTTTGGALGSSGAAAIPLFRERVKCIVASSSGNSNSVTFVVAIGG